MPNFIMFFLKVLGVMILVAPLVNFILAIAFCVKSGRDTTYEVKHSTGIFFFREKDYPQDELTAFSEAVADLKDTSV